MSSDFDADGPLDESPQGQQRRWTKEFESAKKDFEPFHTDAKAAVDAYRLQGADKSTRRPMFAANVNTQRAVTYGQTPKSDASRRFADAEDDVARVASTMLERIINTDIERAGDGYADALKHALCDKRVAGLGLMKWRYEAGEPEVTPAQPAMTSPAGHMAPEVPEVERFPNQDVACDWVYWGDVLWGWTRTYDGMRWIAFKRAMPRSALRERFGEVLGDLVERIPLNSRRDGEKERSELPWDRADVWEVWCKDTKKVYWFVEGFSRILDAKDDYLELDGFLPCQEPMLSNTATDIYLPTPDYKYAQPMYRTANKLAQRIDDLIDYVKVLGVYDGSIPELAAMLKKQSGTMTPAESWASISEKGGLKGCVDWFPMEMVVNAITVLREQLREEEDAARQFDGMSDIMRGQASMPNVTATEQGIKAQFGSVRLQSEQDAFAAFASKGLEIKKQLICKKFDAQTIINRSNIMFTADGKDPELIQKAVQLLKDRHADFRIEVKPESVKLQDFAQMRNERTELMTAVGGFMQQAVPVGQMLGPQAGAGLLELLSQFLAGIKGADGAEAIIDRMAEQLQDAAEAAAQNPQAQAPDPEQVKAQAKQQEIAAKGQMDMQREQLKLHNALILKQADVAAHASMEATQREENTQEAFAKHAIAQALKPQPGPNGGQS